MLDISAYIGQKFNRLTVIGAGTHIKRKDFSCNKLIYVVVCRCECGTIKEFRLHAIKHGYTKSCGCLTNEVLHTRSFKHGLSKVPLYAIWTGMKQRCINPNKRAYMDYGARGISVCKEWANDFMIFYNWAINNGYKKGLEIDRLNNNGNYTPDNCWFTTRLINAQNKRDSLTFLYRNETKSLNEWAKILNVKYITIYHRLRTGMSFTEAIECKKRINQYF